MKIKDFAVLAGQTKLQLLATGLESFASIDHHGYKIPWALKHWNPKPFPKCSCKTQNKHKSIRKTPTPEFSVGHRCSFGLSILYRSLKIIRRTGSSI